MSTTYYICRKKEYERAEAITNYVDRIQRTLHSYLDVSLPPELKDKGDCRRPFERQKGKNQGYVLHQNRKDL